MRRLLVVSAVLVLAAIGAVWAGPFSSVGPLVQVSGTSPFAGCTADNVAGQPGTNYANSEVEPWVAVNPLDPSHVVGTWQQDRWSNGGARGLVAGVSFDGGVTWTSVVMPRVSACSGNPDFLRVSDPWVSFGPNGHLYHISLSIGLTGGFLAPSAMLVNKSTDGGLTWSAPVTLIRDDDPNILNDKESMTADPDDANYVYAIWDRLEIPVGQAAAIASEHAIGYRGPTWFARTTDGGATWESARMIYDPGEVNQTIGNQIVVHPDGTLVNAFNLIFNFKNAHKVRGYNVAVLRSPDRGLTWSGPVIVTKLLSKALFDPQGTGVQDPETRDRVRTGDILPEVAVDRNSGSPGYGNLYLVWQDSRFSNNGNFSNLNLLADEVAFSQSTDGGLTWSAPVKINKTPTNTAIGNRQAFTPSVRVAADGTVGVTYYDFRNNTADPNTLWTDYFIVHCHPTTATSCADAANWGDEARLTDTSFDMRKAPFARGFFVGDYEGLDVGGNSFTALFSMPHGTDPASVFFRKIGP